MLIIIFAASAVVFPQTGKLSGRITDAASGEPLIGANIIIEGTTQGTASDLDGYYSILNLRPGSYTVRYQYIGYNSEVVKDIKITSDKTTTQDVKLSSAAIESETVVITAKKPIVEFNQTSSVKTVSSEEIQSLPVQSLTDIINLQAGIVQSGDQFHIRGGRFGEVQFQVEGVSINNPFNNEASLSVDRSIIEEVSVVSGTFDAKYGQAMSGIINTTLKSGSDKFAFSGEVYGGDYLPLDNAIYPNNKDFHPYDVQNYQLTLSGPTYIPNTTFLVSGRRYHNNGFLWGERRFMPTDTNNLFNGTLYPTGDGKKIAMNPYDEWSGQFKLTNNSLDKISISYVAIANYLWGKIYDFAYRFDPEGLKDKKTFSINHGIDFTHTLSDNMFYKISVRHNYFDYKEYKYESIYDPRYYQADYPKSIDWYEYGAIIQGVDIGRNSQLTNFGDLKLDYTWQANKENYIEAGIDGQINQIKFGPPGQLQVLSDSLTGIVRLQPKVIDPNDPRFKKVETYYPRQGAAYIQDRIELGDLVVRAGLRYEYFDPEAYIPTNLQNPANTIKGVPGSVLKKAKIKNTFAPRLGFGFPLTDKSSLHFSYGHFYQMPQYSALYENANYQVLEFLTGGDTYQQDYLGNPDLKPEVTVQYEVGLKQALNDNLGLDLTFFYKDIRDLLGTEVIETYNFGEYARNTNVDYGSVSGITLSLTQRPVGNFGATVDYSLMFANGNSSNPRETADRALGGQDPRPRDIPFDWDQRHTLNVTAVYQIPEDFSVSTIIRYASGQPYTPELGVGFLTQQEKNSGRKPSYATVDLRAEKYFNFAFSTFSIFLRVFNLFNQDYDNGEVYADTGDPLRSIKLRPGEPVDPNRFNAPRRIEFGISLRSN
ncbi:MAG TPA: TonB-dependent receptor [Ignavibacteriaceae bacterium]|nr:TonB-dependent receptor [Ignavibacteriaceae bacterium]